MSSFIDHGGDLAQARADFGGAPEDWIDLSTGINPWPYPLPAIPPEAWTQLPQPDAEERLLAAARKAYGVPDGARIVPAPGVQALIQTLPNVYIRSKVSIVSPTYSEYWPAFKARHHKVREVKRAVRGDSILIVCSPNNPDGRVANPNLADHPPAGSVMIVDEAFADPTPKVSFVPYTDRENIVVLRSFGKFFGLPGVRLGFAICHSWTAGTIAERLGPWAVSGPALAIGEAALRDSEWQAAMRIKLAKEARKLDKLLRKAGLRVVGGTPLFRLTETPGEAEEWHEHLARAQIWTRPFMGQLRWLRFGLPGTAEAWERLEMALLSPAAPAAD